jgi:hypothetical protein
MAALGGVVVLFGGLGALRDPHLFGDTWTFDGTTWTQQAPPVSPPAREGHAMATAGDRVVLFGGSDLQGNPMGDTWTWDGATWRQESPPASPPARSAHAMAPSP